MSESLSKLRAMTVDELVSRHDHLARGTVVSTRHYLDEIHRRDDEKSTNVILRLTRWIVVMTAVVTGATIVNTILFFISK